MTVPDDVESRIVDRAEYVEEALSVLADKRSLDRETYRTDREQRAIVEREFQHQTARSPLPQRAAQSA